jgi:hypothetical protein
MFTPDPGTRIRMFSIPDPIFSIADPGSASKNLRILPQKNGFWALRNMIRVVHPGSRIRILIFYPSRIPGSKNTWSQIPDPNPQHWFVYVRVSISKNVSHNQKTLSQKWQDLDQNQPSTVPSGLRNWKERERQFCGSVTFWYGSGSGDPYLWPMDPAIFISDLQDGN